MNWNRKYYPKVLEWRRKNPDKVREYNRDYYKRNRERLKRKRDNNG